MDSGPETTGAQRRRREPERGALHQVLREHLATFLVRSSEQDGPGLPRFVTRELERALTCGVLAHGFARVRCRPHDPQLAARPRRGGRSSRRQLGRGGEDHAEPDEPVPDEPLLALMSAASVEGRVALGPTSGQPLTRRGRQRDRRPLFLPGELCCDLEGFSLHAKVAIEGHDRAGLERLCRYIARPAIASERLSIDPDGRVVYRLRRAWRDGTSAIVFEPLAFLERLAALVPRPRAHLVTYHGVLAPAAQWRERIVPGPRALTEPQHGSPECNTDCPRPVSGSTDSPAALSNPARTRRLRWAELLRRVFAVDVLTCPYCGGARRLIATITDGLVVRRILDHLELPSSPPPIAPPRAPPEPEFAW